MKTSGRALKLAHRVWSYDTNGNFLGTIHLSETVYLTHNGNVQTGSFKLDFYDPDGNFQTEVAGSVIPKSVVKIGAGFGSSPDFTRFSPRSVGLTNF